jgi:hypothetical protein
MLFFFVCMLYYTVPLTLLLLHGLMGSLWDVIQSHSTYGLIDNAIEFCSICCCGFLADIAVSSFVWTANL